MKPTLFLRIASVLTFIHAVMHTVGGVFGPTPAGPATIAVQAMKANQFLVMGQTRSYWDFHRGFGLGLSVFLTAEAIIFWQLGSLARSDAHRLRPILSTFFIAYLALAVNSNTYFFFGPVVAEILIAACLAGAILTAESHSVAFAEAPQQA